MPAQGTDLVMIERAGTLHKMSLAEVAALGSGGAAAIATAEIDLGYPVRRNGTFNIPVSAQTVGKPVQVSLARGPYTGKGALPGEEGMYAISFSGVVTAANAITVSFASRDRIGGKIKFNYLIGG